MDRPNSVVCVCETHEEAERAMYNLQAAHIDIGTLSIATKDLASNIHKVDYYDLGEETFAIPGIGPLLVSGPLASRIVAAFNDVATLKGVSILGAALSAIGIAPDSILKYEAALRTDKYLLIVHGSPAAVASALAAIGGTVHCFHTVHGEKVWDEARSTNLSR
jgi:hypothetical protein